MGGPLPRNLKGGKLTMQGIPGTKGKSEWGCMEAKEEFRRVEKKK